MSLKLRAINHPTPALDLAEDFCEPSLICPGDAPRSGAFVEARLICGRRAGKSFILTLVAVFLAFFRDRPEYLHPASALRTDPQQP